MDASAQKIATYALIESDIAEQAFPASVQLEKTMQPKMVQEFENVI
jgi:hypothetical protein